jgi:N-acetyl-anhydromuramyl-L-alanine amidase AmpD
MLVAALALATVAAPPIVQDRIPYPAVRKREMAAYSKRHYGVSSYRLSPRAIVLHFTANNSYSATWNTFASNSTNNGELPGTCAHFVISKDGVIHQLVSLRIRCRHTIGMNDSAIGIEMVQETGQGAHWADQQILHRPKQINAAVRLVKWLQARYHIGIGNVIGHAMANQSRLFHDLEGWRNDHSDWQRVDVRAFHRLLR